MSDNGNSRQNGAEPPARKSLREIAEESYDEVLDAADDGDAGAEPEPEVDAGGPTRDARGRFAPRTPGEEPGEAEPETAPSPDEQSAQPQDPAHPAAQARSSEPPANWSAADQEVFRKLPPEGQSFLLRRHSEMEGDYQRRVTANAAATQFTSALSPVFNDPVIAQSLRENQLSAADAIHQWASMHKRAVSPNVQDRVQLWQEIGQRLGLDPAAVYGQSRPAQQPALSEQELKDPAIRYFADHVSRTVQEVQALRGQITGMQQAAAQQAHAEAAKVTRWGIDGFADEVGQDGKKLRPDFDAVLPQIIELFTSNPNRDLREAYEQARWMNPQTRQTLIAAERNTVTRQHSDQRARQAVRTNTRGLTSPVSKPPSEPGKPKTLREQLEETADEIGFGS